MAFQHEPDSESAWVIFRSHFIIPILPYYYIAVASVALYLNPHMFITSMLLVFSCIMLVATLSLYFAPSERRPNSKIESTPHSPPQISYSPPHCTSNSSSSSAVTQSSWESYNPQEQLKEELAKLKHEEGCESCREKRMQEEFVKGLARKLWEDEKTERQADEVSSAPAVGKKGKRRRRT